MIRRTIREWERIAYGSGDTEIVETQADRLAAVARASTFIETIEPVECANYLVNAGYASLKT